MAGGGVGEAALAMAIIGASTSVVSGFMGQRASQLESAQLQEQRDQEKLAAKQRSAEISRSLRETLGTQRALYASRGIADIVGTPSDVAAESKRLAQLDQDINTVNLGGALRENKFARSQARLAGVSSLISGFGGAATAGLEGFIGYKAAGNVPQPPPSGAGRTRQTPTYGRRISGPYGLSYGGT